MSRLPSNPYHCRAINGMEYDPFSAPDALLINPHVIARVLGNQCRWGGHVDAFMSVARHSLHVADVLRIAFPDRPDLYRWGLMHDAAEAFMQDIKRPLKIRWPEYQDAEHKTLERLARLHHLPWPMPREVKEADDFVMEIENQALRPREVGQMSAIETQFSFGRHRERVTALLPWPRPFACAPSMMMQTVEFNFMEYAPRDDRARWLARYFKLFLDYPKDLQPVLTVAEIKTEPAEPAGENMKGGN